MDLSANIFCRRVREYEVTHGIAETDLGDNAVRQTETPLKDVQDC